MDIHSKFNPDESGQNSKLDRVVFTGGGTTGHVTKNIILLKALREQRPDIERHYVGLKQGKEAELIGPDLAAFHPISSGKLRRYFSLQTIPDFFRFLRGIFQSYRVLGRIKPKLVFSSGGYVALPVAIAAKWRGIPIITHETDSYPGLANRMIGKRADKILLGYASAEPYFKGKHTLFVGNPVSPDLFEGSKERALNQLGFSSKRKTLMVMGGSQGAQQINEIIWEILPELLERDWQVIHLVGKGKGGGGQNSKTPKLQESRRITGSRRKKERYKAFEYVTDEYADFLNAADLVISRAGGNSLAEIEALGKPAILIPLPSSVAAGDHQRKNAEEMLEEHPNWSILSDPKPEELLDIIRKPTLDTHAEHRKNAAKRPEDRILEVILRYF